MAGLTKIQSGGIGDDIDFDGEGTLILDSTNNRVGIGTSSPNKPLHIFSGSSDAEIRLQTNSGTEQNSYITLRQSSGDLDLYTVSSGTNMKFHTVNNERLRINSSGNVGIGTTSPSALLHLAANAPYITFEDKDNNQDWQLQATAWFALRDQTNNAERLRITSSGNVGIGTTSPIRPLSVSNGGAEGFEFGPGDTSGTNLTLHYNRSTSAYIGSVNQAQYHTWSGGGASEKMRIDSSGRVLVGTTTEGAVNADNLTINDSGNCGLTIRSGNTGSGNIYFSDSTSGTAEFAGAVLYDHNDDRMMLYSASTERARIDSSGNLQVSTGQFTVGTTATTGLQFINDGTFGTIHSANLVFRTVSTERMRIDNSGRLLINNTTSNQDHPLQVTASASSAHAIAINARASDDIGELTFFSNNRITRQGEIQYRNDQVNIRHRSGSIRFATGGTTERMRIDSSGNLGVGTTSVDFSQFGSATGGVAIEDVGGTNTGLKIGDGSNDNYLIAAGNGNFYQSHYGSGAMIFGVGNGTGTERMRIDSTGGLYIGDPGDYGTSNYAQSSGNGNFYYRKDNGASSGSIIASNNADRGWSLAYLNKFAWSSGDDGRWINFFKNGSSVASISLTSTGTVSYGTGSDYRLKENVTEITDGITRLKQLQPKQFNMIDDPDNAICDGFLAHELQTVVSQAVTGVKDAMRIDEFTGEEVPDYQEVDYGKITPLLTAALQEAITKIETLEAEVAALKSN